MADQNAQRDDNFVPSLLGISSSDANETAAAAVDPATNRLLVNATISGGGAGGTASQDDTAFTAGTGNGTPMMGFATSDTVDAGDVGVLAMLTNRQLKTTLYDSSGVELSVGGGTQYVEDAAAAANPTGNILNLVRNDARSGSLTTTDGDNVSARGTNSGELYVKHVDSIPVTDNSGSLTVDYATTGSGTATGALRVELPTNGTGVVGLAAGSNVIGAITNLIPGTGNTNLGSSVDAAVGATKVGVLAIGVRDDALTTLTPIDNDYTEGLRVDSTGAHWVRVTTIDGALPAGTNAIGKLSANSGVDIGDVDVTTVGTITPGTAASSLGKAEDAAHTTGDVGVFSLGVRNDTLADITSTTADYSQLSTDIKGRVMTAGVPRSLIGTAQVQLSNTTSETTILAATASTFHDVYGIILANTGSSTTKVSIRDDTAGTVRMIIEVPTLETRGFMLPVDSAAPQTATNKNWTAQCGTATTALEVTLFYVSMV